MSVVTGGGHVVFITEGGPDVGLGHVSRCAALARAAVADGARVSFLVNEDARVDSVLRGVPADIVSVPWPVDHETALGTVQARSPDVVVVDSYRASPDFLVSLRRLASVVAVDDLADRPLPVDVVVNGGAGAEKLSYERAPDTLFLLGPRYALLDARYAEAPHRAATDHVGRVLICLGGGRHVGVIVAALDAVDRLLTDCIVDVAAGPFAAGVPALDAAARTARNRVRIRRARFGLRALMLSADVAISGAGVTLHELAATATPSVAVCMADNQRPNWVAFDEAGATLAGGMAGDAALGVTIESALERLAADGALRASLGARGRLLVDGQGAMRVARAIVRPVTSLR